MADNNINPDLMPHVRQVVDRMNRGEYPTVRHGVVVPSIESWNAAVCEPISPEWAAYRDRMQGLMNSALWNGEMNAALTQREISATEVRARDSIASLHQAAFIRDFDAARESFYRMRCAEIFRDDFAQRTVEYWNIASDMEWWEETSRFRGGIGLRQSARRAGELRPEWNHFVSSDYAPTQRSIRFHDETPTEGSIPMARVKGDSAFQTIDNFMTRLITPQNNLPARSDVC